MSWYYNLFIGRKIKDGIELVGPYDNKGKIRAVYTRNRHCPFENDFIRYDGEELKEKLYSDLVSILPYNNLPTGDFIKSGYFLIEDVEQYLKDRETEDIFYDKLTPEAYAERLKTEAILGPPRPKKDIEGNEYEVHSCMDYMYFAYQDYESDEYVAFMIRWIIGILDPYNFERDDIVVVMCEG